MGSSRVVSAGGGRRCAGEKEIIEVTAGLAEAGHVGVDGW